MYKRIQKAISIFILVAFVITSIKAPAYAQMAVDPMPRMSAPGVMVHLSPEYAPAYLKGIVIHPENALKFDFIIYKGDKLLTDEQKKEEYTKLTKYFLASLAIPDDDQWVNLSPYEKDRIIKGDFGKTEMGRDLLAQDYMLKQVTASLIYPEDNLGKKFWDRVYTQAQKQYGTTNIPVNTFNKVWILPDDALIYEKGNTAYVLKNHLRVMLEEDYLALQKHSGIQSAPVDNKTHSIASKIVKEIVLPELEREVNEDKNFAVVRQVYSGMILAAWYKRALKESLLSRIYADKSKVKGVDQDPKTNEQIYRQYLRAYKKGVFNFIKEDVDKYTNETIPRKYFSGGGQGVTWAANNLYKGKVLGNLDDPKAPPALIETTSNRNAAETAAGEVKTGVDDMATIETEEQGVSNAVLQKIEEVQTAGVHETNQASDLEVSDQAMNTKVKSSASLLLVKALLVSGLVNLPLPYMVYKQNPGVVHQLPALFSELGTTAYWFASDMGLVEKLYTGHATADDVISLSYGIDDIPAKKDFLNHLAKSGYFNGTLKSLQNENSPKANEAVNVLKGWGATDQAMGANVKKSFTLSLVKALLISGLVNLPVPYMVYKQNPGVIQQLPSLFSELGARASWFASDMVLIEKASTGKATADDVISLSYGMDGIPAKKDFIKHLAKSGYFNGTLKSLQNNSPKANEAVNVLKSWGAVDQAMSTDQKRFNNMVSASPMVSTFPSWG